MKQEVKALLVSLDDRNWVFGVDNIDAAVELLTTKGVEARVDTFPMEEKFLPKNIVERIKEKGMVNVFSPETLIEFPGYMFKDITRVEDDVKLTFDDQTSLLWSLEKLNPHVDIEIHATRNESYVKLPLSHFDVICYGNRVEVAKIRRMRRRLW